MKHFDVLVIGTGSGMLVASVAVDSGLKVAVVDNGPMGGTCINRGCVPSKMLIYPSDVATLIRGASKLGVNASVNSIDFRNIMTRMHTLVAEDTGSQARAIEATPQMKWYKETGEFTNDYTFQVSGETLRADRIYITSGSRVKIPKIKGLDTVDYLTSDTVLELQEPSKSLIILGGGYIGVEYGHFFSGIGVKTTLVQRPPTLLKNEEPEVSELLKLELQKRMDIYTSHEAVEVKQEGNEKIVVAKNLADGSLKEFRAEALMVAAGRAPNSDLLKPERTGVKVDERGFIKVNEYLETDKKNIWAFGDAIGKHMFKHVANYEAGIAWHNSVHDHKAAVDYSAVPHAVFSEPQITSVGLKEAEAKQQGYKILVGTALYKDTAMGAAMGEPNGFVKAIVEQNTGRILGAHIIGPEASILIQEVINAMNTADRSYAPIIQSMHIHPAMPEVVQNAFGNLQPTEHEHTHTLTCRQH
ncbi:MAG: dihydrolipoyl dehydrogenase [Candidatus Bathyarchaeota archaeon]|nr:dihydrolipoyl dehydrogenase [Candidatus Bathyarchaeota archaeon]